MEGVWENRRLIFSGQTDGGLTNRVKWLKRFLSGRKNQLLNLGASENSTIDIYSLFSKSAKDAWKQSFRLAKKRGGKPELEEIFLALLKELSVQELLKRLGAKAEDARILLDNYLKLKQPSGGETITRIPFEAFALAVKLRDHKVGSLMLLGALLKTAPKDSMLQAIFSNIGLTLDKLEVLAVWQVKLNFDFPESPQKSGLLDCARQAEFLERQFGYRFDFSAIETATALSSADNNSTRRRKNTLRLLVKAGLLAKQGKNKTISALMVKKSSA